MSVVNYRILYRSEKDPLHVLRRTDAQRKQIKQMDFRVYGLGFREIEVPKPKKTQNPA